MRAVILKTDTTIEPFGDPAREAYICGETLGHAQEEIFRKAGFEVLHADRAAGIAGECLLLFDHAFVSAAMLEGFKAHLKTNRPGVLAVKRSAMTEYLLPAADVQADGVSLDVFYDLFHLPAGYGLPDLSARELRARLLSEAVPYRVRHEGSVRIENSGGYVPAPHTMSVPETEALAAHVSHWAHVLWLNHLVVKLRLEDLRPGGGNCVGRGCDVHPTAYVEDSIIEDGAKLGPNASIRGSFVGAGAVLSENARVLNSVIGENVFVLADTYINHCTAYPESTIGNIMARHCVFGRGIFVTTGVIIIESEFDRPPRMEKAGGWVDLANRPIGICVGHGSTLGARATILPGRTVPNGYVVVMRAEEGVFKIPKGLPEGTPVVWHEGAIEEVAKVKPGYNPPEI